MIASTDQLPKLSGNAMKKVRKKRKFQSRGVELTASRLLSSKPAQYGSHVRSETNRERSCITAGSLLETSILVQPINKVERFYKAGKGLLVSKKLKKGRSL